MAALLLRRAPNLTPEAIEAKRTKKAAAKAVVLQVEVALAKVDAAVNAIEAAATPKRGRSRKRPINGAFCSCHQGGVRGAQALHGAQVRDEAKAAQERVRANVDGVVQAGEGCRPANCPPLNRHPRYRHPDQLEQR